MHPPTLEEAELVGKGYTSDVYARGQGRVLKLYHGWVGREVAEREFSVTRAALATGLLVPDAYELVEVEGRFGIVFERVEGESLLGSAQRRPWSVFGAIRTMAELHGRVHRFEAPAGLQTLRERIGAGIEGSDSTAEDKQAARDRLAALPDGTALCHGDFQPSNVLIAPRGPAVIDWACASRGDPLGDVACTSWMLRTACLPPWSPGYAHLMLACLRSSIHRSYLRHYFRLNPGTSQEIEAWQIPIAVAARSWRVPAAQDGKPG